MSPLIYLKLHFLLVLAQPFWLGANLVLSVGAIFLGAQLANRFAADGPLGRTLVANALAWMPVVFVLGGVSIPREMWAHSEQPRPYLISLVVIAAMWLGAVLTTLIAFGLSFTLAGAFERMARLDPDATRGTPP